MDRTIQSPSRAVEAAPDFVDQFDDDL